MGVKVFFKASDGVEIQYNIEGDGDPLIFLNGLWGVKSSWNNQTAFFAKKYKCITYDHRGIGGSEKWRGEYSYTLHARDLKELLEILNIKKAIFIGTCHGGMTAVSLAIEYPEMVQALCINGTQLLKSEKQKHIYEGWKSVLRTSDFKTLYKTIIPTIMSDKWLLNNNSRLESMAVEVNERVDKKAAINMIEACKKYGYNDECISAINAPTLVIAGDEDSFILSDKLRKEARFIRNSEFVLFKGCGHFPQREMIEDYNIIINSFITQVKQHEYNLIGSCI